jgi:hypothetical protein
MGGKSKAPKAPDLVAANAQQVQLNKDAATDVMNTNRYSQSTPFASNEWVTGPDGKVTNTTTLSPEQQSLYMKNNALAQQMSGNASGALDSFMGKYWGGGGGGSSSSSSGGGGVNIPNSAGKNGNLPGGIQNDLDYSKLTAMPTTDPAAARQQAQDALYNMNAQYLDPQWKASQSSLATKLSNQGLVPGTEAYNRAMQVENDAQQKAYESARQGAIAGGGAEAERAQNMALQLRNQGMTEAGNLGAFHNAAQDQGAKQWLQKYGYDSSKDATLGAAGINAGASMSNAQLQADAANRQESFNELLKMGQFGQSGQMIPQFGTSQGNMGSYGTGNLVGAEQQQYQNAAQAAQNKGGMLPALAGMAGTYFGGPLLGAAGKGLGTALSNYMTG